MADSIRVRLLADQGERHPQLGGPCGDAWLTRWAVAQVPELLEPGLTAYMCGPVPFMGGVQDDLTALGFDTARLYQESFAF